MAARLRRTLVLKCEWHIISFVKSFVNQSDIVTGIFLLDN